LPKKLNLIFGEKTKTVKIHAQPTLNDILKIIPNQFPQLSQKAPGLAYKVNDKDFVLATTDNDIADAFRTNVGRELNLYVTTSDGEDALISNIENRVAQLTILSKEIQLIKQNYLRTLQTKVSEQEERQKYYDGLLQNFKNQSAGLEAELQKLRDSTASLNIESAKFKESLKVLVNQYQSKIQEAADLKRERDEKVMLEAKVLQLQKDLNEKNEENFTMSKRIQTISEERDIFNKKSEELEVRQQTLESNYLHESLKITTTIPDSLQNMQNSAPSTNGTSLPFTVPSDLSEMDIQVLLFAGVKLDTPSDQQKVF
jgi:chromosome segregation ATPase